MILLGCVGVNIDVVDERGGKISAPSKHLLNDSLKNLRQWLESKGSTTKHHLDTIPSEGKLYPILRFDGELVEAFGEVNFGNEFEAFEASVNFAYFR